MAISFHCRRGVMAKRPRPIHQLTAAQFERMFPDEDACRAYLVARRWPQGVRCPRCGNPAVYDLPSRKWHWQCEKCAPDGYRFSHIAGTIFENTNKPLRDWYRIAHLMLTSKKGVRPGGRALPALRRHGPLRGQRCGCDEPPSSFQCSFCMSSRSDEYL